MQITYIQAHKILENIQKLITNTCFDTCNTGSSAYIMYANIFNSVVEFYYKSDSDNYNGNALASVIAQHFTYNDSAYVYVDIVKNTALENTKLSDYVYLTD
jgi:hypothetical protein